MFPILANAQGPGPWWPDPATHSGLAVWVAYSRNYEDMYSNPAFVEQDVAALVQEGVEVVFVAISSSTATPHLQSLSNRTAQLTNDVQSYLNQLRVQGILTCAAILSDNFTGAPEQLDRVTLVDHLVNFNRDRGPSDAGFTCVATDLEMAPGSRNTAVYDLWKQFHRNMKARIAAGGSDLRLLAWMQGPDFLIDRMDDPQDQAALMLRESIAQVPTDPALYTGAIRYFTTQDSGAIFDAVIPMWFFTPLGPYMRRLEHNFSELQNLAADKPFLIAGMMIQNETAGLCCVGCIAGRTEYLTRLDFNDTLRVPPFILIGTGVFKWRIPADWTCGISASSALVETEACAASEWKIAWPEGEWPGAVLPSLRRSPCSSFAEKLKAPVERPSSRLYGNANKLVPGTWIHIVAVDEPGDEVIDLPAGVHIHKNGVHGQGPPSSGTLHDAYGSSQFTTRPSA